MAQRNVGAKVVRFQRPQERQSGISRHGLWHHHATRGQAAVWERMQMYQTLVFGTPDPLMSERPVGVLHLDSVLGRHF
jgi:hypothetical protein